VKKAFPRTSDRSITILSLLLVMLLWGSTYVVTKAVIAEVPPLLLAFLRFAIASAILVALARARGGTRRLPRPTPWGTLALMGFAGVTVFYIGFNSALANTTAAAASLLQATAPAVTAVLAAVFLAERLRLRRGVGIGLSLVGAALVVLASAGGADAPNPLLGDLLMLLAVLAWAVYTILGKGFAAVPSLAVTAYGGVLGTLFLLPAAAYDLATRPPTHVSLATWLAILYLGAGPSALNYLLWNRALRVLDASAVANFLNLVPLIGVASATIFLGEALLPTQLLGGALVLVGVWLSSG
jgi:drug/metabolite transporter (DMT)-like permease